MKAITAIIILLATTAAADNTGSQVRFRSFNNTGGGEMYLGVPDLGVPENRLELDWTWAPTDFFRFGYAEWDIGGITEPRAWAELGYSDALATAKLINQRAMREANMLRVVIWNREPDGWVSMPALQLRRGNDIETLPPFEPTETIELYQLQRAGWCPGRDLDWSLDGIIERSGVFSNSQEKTKIEISVITAGFWPQNECSDTVFRDGFED